MIIVPTAYVPGEFYAKVNRPGGGVCVSSQLQMFTVAFIDTINSRW